MGKYIKDERIIQEANKQNNIGFTILYFGILLDLLYRQFILQEPISKLWSLALLFFGVSLYIAISRVSSGLLAYKDNKKIIKQILPSSIIAAIIYTVIVNRWWFGNDSPIELAIEGIIFFTGFLGINFFMHYISNKKNDAMFKDD